MTDTKAVTQANETTKSEAVLLPAVNVVEDATGITLSADMPGVPKDKLSLQVEGNTLTIAGEVSLNVPAGMEAVHAEVSIPRYRRVFTLSKELNADNIEATFNQGVLKLRIPKVEQAQPRKIAISVA